MKYEEHVRELDRLHPAGSGLARENVVLLEQVGSTNLLARSILREYVKECEEMPPVLVVAWEQTAGRGRQGRSWSSPPGRGVYATLAFQVAAPEELQALPLLAGVGLSRTLDRLLPVPCRLKWPNDLLVGRRKIGGILIETVVQPDECVAAVLGFGVNLDLGEDELPDERATSLRLEGGAPVSLAELTWELATGLERELAHRGDPAYAVEAYRERSVHRPGDHLVVRMDGRLDGEVVEGTFAGFDEHGLLLLDPVGGRAGEPAEGGRLRLSAGEVITEG
jgi:BirA family transcriptional regulator, biotin operon repressor / biotin---[acetyl-CoA-carboxylase] ligase